MKGVRYSLRIKKFKDEYNEYSNLDMKTLIKYVERDLLELHDIECSINNQTIYNILKRPKGCSRLIRNFVFINYVPK